MLTLLLAKNTHYSATMAHGQFHKESISPRFYVPNIHKHTAR